MTKQYRVPDAMDLTTAMHNIIQKKTGIDVANPPTMAAGAAALLWWVAQDNYTWPQIVDMPLAELQDLIEDEDDDLEIPAGANPPVLPDPVEDGTDEDGNPVPFAGEPDPTPGSGHPEPSPNSLPYGATASHQPSSGTAPSAS